MSPRPRVHLSPLLTFAICLGAWFVLALFIEPGLAAALNIDSAFGHHLLIKSLLLAAVFAAMWIDGRPLSHFGLRRSRAGVRWRGPAALALILGLASTAALLLSPAAGMRSVAELGFLQLVTAVWFGSSLAEEFFTRGLAIGWMTPDQESLKSDSPHHRKAVNSSTQIASSALLFGCMHLTLLFGGSDHWTVVIVVVATTLLGALCADVRLRTGGLYPAFMTHLLYNVGGFVGGIVLVLSGAVSI